MDFDPHAILTRLRGGSNASSTTPAAQKASNPVSGTPYQSYSNSRDYSTSQSASKTKTDKKKKGKELIPTHLHATRTAIGTPGIVNSSNSSPKASSIVSNMRDTYNSNGNSADANSLGSGKTGSSRHSLTHYDTTNEVTALEIRTDLERALQEIKNENADLKAQLKALTREHKSLNDDYEAYKSKMGETTSKLRGQIVDQNRQLNEMRILAHPNSPATKAIRTVNGKAIAKGLKYDPNAVPPPPTVYQERALSEALHRADASSHRSFTKPTFSELMRRSGSSTDEHGTPANISHSKSKKLLAEKKKQLQAERSGASERMYPGESSKSKANTLPPHLSQSTNHSISLGQQTRRGRSKSRETVELGLGNSSRGRSKSNSIRDPFASQAGDSRYYSSGSNGSSVDIHSSFVGQHVDFTSTKRDGVDSYGADGGIHVHL